MADRRSRFAVAPARGPLPADHHRLVRLRRIPHASPAGSSYGREMGPYRNLSPVKSIIIIMTIRIVLIFITVIIIIIIIISIVMTIRIIVMTIRIIPNSSLKFRD